MNLYYKFIILFSLSVTLLFAGMSSGTADYVFKPKGYDGQLYDFFLPNGMKAIMMEKHSSPHVAVNIYYNVGSRDDPKGQKGITNIISKLYKMDSKNYISKERNRILTTLNAEHGLVYDQDIFYVNNYVHNEDIEKILKIESDRMGSLIIDENTLQRAKEKIKSQYILEKQNNFYAIFDSLETVYWPEGHPYKTLPFGMMEQIDTISVQTVREYFKTYFNPNNATIVIVGNIDPENTTKLIYNFFGHLESYSGIPPLVDLSSNKKFDTNEVVYLQHETEEIPVFVNLFKISYSGPSPRENDAIIFETIWDIMLIDLQSRGKIFNELTKKYVTTNYNIDNSETLVKVDGGFFGANIFKKTNMKKTKKVIQNALNLLIQEGFDIETIDQFKKKTLLKSYKDEKNYSYLAKNIGFAELIRGDYKMYGNKIEILKNLTNEDIKRVAKIYLSEERRMSITIDINQYKWAYKIPSFFLNGIILPIVILFLN